MGYDLHITRRAEWSDPDSGPPITREEFERVVLGDARFRRDEGLGRDFAVLVKQARGSHDPPWLCWQDGEILTKNPPRSVVKLAVELADKLDARVVGDDGEEYGADGRAAGDGGEEHDEDGAPDGDGDPGHVESNADMRKRLWRERVALILQWLGIAAFLAIFAALLGTQLDWW